MPTTLTRLLYRLRRLATPSGEDSDAALLERFVRRHDEEAFAALVERHGPMVRNACRRLLADAHEAEDAFQATFLVLARKARSVGRPTALAGWLYGVARRVALKARAAGGRRPQTALGEGAEPYDSHPDPLAEVTARELLAALEDEVARLPQAYRLPVVLVCLEGLSQEEAARRLGCSPGAVKGRLERGRRRLQDQLRRRGLTLAAALATVEVARALGQAAVPASWSAAVARTAAAFAARKGAAAGPVSAAVAALAKEVLRAMYVKQLAAAGMLALFLLGFLGAGAGLLFSGTATKGQFAGGAERLGGAAGPDRAGAANAPPGDAQKPADRKEGEPPDLLKAQRDRMLVDEQKLSQEVDAALRKARAAAPQNPEAARRLRRQTLLRVWDDPDVSERVRDALLARVLAAGPQQPGRAVGPGPQPAPVRPEAPFAWGQPHNGLRVGLALAGPGRAGGVRVALALENMTTDNLTVKLGAMRDTGKQPFPNALRLVLTDAKGGVRVLRRTFSRVAGRLDPFVVPLPAGCRYTLRYDLADLVDVDQDPAVVGLPWAPGRYRAAVEFVGEAVSRQESPALAAMNYWKGTARSGELTLVLPVRPGP